LQIVSNCTLAPRSDVSVCDLVHCPETIAIEDVGRNEELDVPVVELYVYRPGG
jgi:hypothetical protein